jgi:excisionase family DNA binding protein
MKTKQLSIKELAALLGVSTDTVRRAARSKLIPSSREGTAYRFDWEKVRQAMRGRARELGSHRACRRARRTAKADRAHSTAPPTW